MKKLLLCSILLLALSARSQVNLGISPYTFVIYADTTTAGSLDSADVYVVNSDSVNPFSGPLEIHVAVQDSAAMTFHQVDTLSFGTVAIPAGDSIPLTLYQVFDIAPNKYHYDINVIVIWPVAAVASVDSLTFPVFIELPNGIGELDLSRYITAFPNPVSGQFNVQNSSGQEIEEVRIYNAAGQLIRSGKEPRVDTSGWPAGVYLVRLKLVDKRELTLRILKR